MASGGYDNDKDNYFARLWDVETGKELRRFMHGKTGLRHSRVWRFLPTGKRWPPSALRPAFFSDSLTWTPAN